MKKLSDPKGFSATAIIVVIAVILLAAGAFFMMKKSPSGTSPSTATEKMTPEKKESAVSSGDTTSTFADVIGKGQNLECDWHLPTSSAANPFGTGKLYTTGNKGRSMIKGTTNGIDIDANVIYKEDVAYSWVIVAGTTVGYKFDKAELQKMASEMTPEQKQQGEQIRAKMIFSCKSWTPDESKFILPTGVEFK